MVDSWRPGGRRGWEGEESALLIIIYMGGWGFDKFEEYADTHYICFYTTNEYVILGIILSWFIGV